MRSALRNFGISLLLLPMVGQVVVLSASRVGLVYLAGSNEEKWTYVNLAVLCWLAAISVWIAYAIHRLKYRPGL